MGTLWYKSGEIERDNSDNRALAAKAYFFEATTTTPKAVYSDGAETTPLSHPVLADGNGRWPFVSIPYGDYDVQVTTSGGTQLYYYVNVQNDAPVDPGAGVDADALLNTGDIKARYGTGSIDGWVRSNGRTIGNAASGAAERANADTVALFTHLYDNDAALAVSGGRGASAAADYAANKTIATPDFRGRFLAGLDDMGGTASGRLPDLITLGGSSGLSSYTIAQAHLPDYNLSYAGLAISKPNVDINDNSGAGHLHAYAGSAAGSFSGSTTQSYLTLTATGGAVGTLGTGAANVYNSTAVSGSLSGGSSAGNTLGALTNITASLATTPTLSGTLPSGGSGTAISIFPPVLPITIYLRL